MSPCLRAGGGIEPLRRRTRARCEQGSSPGVTRKDGDHSRRIEASEGTDERSVRPEEAGRATWRRSTTSWWCSTRISASLATTSIRWMQIALSDALDEPVEE